MNKAKYAEIPVMKTDKGTDVVIPLEVANELGFMRLNRGPVEFGAGKNRVTLRIDEPENLTENRK